jgi:hypothetical protein
MHSSSYNMQVEETQATQKNKTDCTKTHAKAIL